MEEITGEADYVNAPKGPADKKAPRPDDTKKEAAPEGPVDTKASPPGLRFFLPIAVCWIVLLAIMGLRIYFDTLSHSDPNQSEEVNTLRANNTNLSLENANLTRDNKNLTDQLGNLTQAYHVSERNVKDLSAGFQELETKKNNLTQQIQNMETNRNELNISRAQWSIDSYCLGNTDDKCKACQKGWSLTESSCYAYNDAPPPNRKTWEEAQEDCSGKNSDLAVARDSEEKEAINANSLGPNGFWIGLRVVNKQWKWVDGSDLTESSWIDPPDPADGRCAVFYRNKWSSVSCDRKQQWICQKKALSV